MARIFEPPQEQVDSFNAWADSLPEPAHANAKKFPPWELFRMKSTGQRVTLNGCNDNGTISVTVSGKYNAVLAERIVFGVDPADLEPCDLPEPHEPTGTLLSQQDVADNIDKLRVLIRPDLWEMSGDGTARRRWTH